MALVAMVAACADAPTDPVEAPIATSVVVSPSALGFSSLGEAAQLTAMVHDQTGQPMAGVTLIWASANPAVATVDQSGLVSAVGNGETSIAVAVGTTPSASVAVTVAQVPNSIQLSEPPDSLAVGDSLQMSAEALDALANPIPDVTLLWSSSDATVLTVDQEGWVRARAAGSAAITAAAGTSASATATITAVQVADSVVLSVPRDSLAVGDSVQMSAEALDALGNPIPDVTFRWSSSDTTILTVSQKGWVRARTGGSAEITAATGTTARATATVTAVQVPDSIVLSAPRDSLAVGDSLQLSAEALDALGNPIADVTFAWSSSDTAILTVNQEGWVRARAAGSAEITAALEELSASRSLVATPHQNAEERAALEAFYHATNGPEWKNNTNWLSDKPLRQWYGVETGADGTVVGLDFNKNGLKGRLPAELARLTGLRKLSLWGDWEPGISLTGPIPHELAELSNLTELNLGNNELTGVIPPVLADLTNLTELALVQNQLTGPIPPELGRLANLERLNLGNNHLTGEIPPELWNLTGLRDLHLGGNDLEGEVSPAIGNLIELVELWLGVNDGLSGEIPPEIANLAKLEILWIPDTRLTGPIPPGLGTLSRLRWIWLPGNELTGTIPPELGALQRLESLLLGENKLEGSIPPELGNLSRLETLTLYDNPLTGAIPPELGRLTRLETLSIDGTRLSGPIPPELGNLPNIEKMFLSGELTGPIPPELGNLATLQRLEIASHALTGPIPPELGKLANLTTLSLIGYGLTGPIPPEFWNLGKLVHLTLAYTGITGPLPREIGRLANLEILQLVQTPGDFGRRGAAFTGPLPRELGKLSKLRGIRIGHHAFTGPIPPELGNLSRMTSLIIAQSQGDQSRDGIGLTGPIPSELGKLTELRWIWLDSNDLSGALPAELGSLAELEVVRIGNNELVGRVPNTFLNLDLDEFQWHNNPLCLPDTPAFRAWRGRIPVTLGEYCAGNSETVADRGARYGGMQPTTVELLMPCSLPSGSGIGEIAEPVQGAWRIWSSVSPDCPSAHPGRPPP